MICLESSKYISLGSSILVLKSSDNKNDLFIDLYVDYKYLEHAILNKLPHQMIPF